MREMTRPNPSGVTNPMLPRPFRVVSKRNETADVTTLRMEPADGRSCFRFVPAQFGMVGVPGIGEVPISFSGHPDGSRCLSMTIRDAGAVTHAVVTTPIGALLSLRGPYGTTWPMDESHERDVLFVAGGLGLAPLRSAVLAVADAHEGTQRRSAVVVGAKSPSDLLFRDDLEVWDELEETTVFITVDEADAAWRGSVGLVTTRLAEALETLTSPLVMVCGPDVMFWAASKELVGLGIEPGDIWVTLERNMKCAVGLCGHCQFGPFFLCTDGPVFSFDEVAELFEIREV